MKMVTPIANWDIIFITCYLDRDNTNTSEYLKATGKNRTHPKHYKDQRKIDAKHIHLVQQFSILIQTPKLQKKIYIYIS